MTDRYSVCSARVHRIAREHHLEAALVVRKGIPICVGLDTTGAGGSGSAVVNALQNCDERLDDADIYVTYAPTEADLGMAWLFRIKAIVVQVGEGDFTRFRPSADVSAAGFKTDKISKVELKQAALRPEQVDPLRDDIDSVPKYIGVEVPHLAEVPAQRGQLRPAFGSLRETLFMTIAYAIVSVTWARIAAQEGNKVACIVVDERDHIVSWGINMAEGQGNPSWHAEIVALRRLLASRRATSLGAGYKLYTTLKPCYMCAGMITEIAPQMTIIFGQDDPKIRHSALDRNRRFVQRATNILHRVTKAGAQSFPELLKTMLDASDEKSAIPFLQKMGMQDIGRTFGAAGDWTLRIDAGLRSQHRIARALDDYRRPSTALRGMNFTQRQGLAALDLAIPSPRQTHDDLWVLHQGLLLLQRLGAPIRFG